MPAPQNYKIHARWDPFFHFFILPVLLLNIPVTSVFFVHHHNQFSHSGYWFILISITLFLAALKIRMYAACNQDRIIRLEERMRFASMVPKEDLAAFGKLTMKQVVGLRFASDAELVPLARRAIAENLTQDQIKQAIATWRPDHQRV